MEYNLYICESLNCTSETYCTSTITQFKKEELMPCTASC